MSEFIADKDVSGLYKRVRKTYNSWVVVARIKNGKLVNVNIGKDTLIKVSEARSKAKEILSLLARGINPNEERRAEQLKAKYRKFTLQEALDNYAKIVPWKDSTKYDVYKVIERRFEDWLKKPLISITQQDCLQRFEQIKKDIQKNNRQKNRSSVNPIGEGEAQKAFRYLSAIFNSYIHDDIGDEKLLPKGNPCLVLKAKRVRKTLKPRDRYLDLRQRQILYDHLAASGSKEAKGFIRTTQDDRDLIWLLIHTGLRLEEALTLEWKTVDLINDRFTVFDTKNTSNHTLPMTKNIKSMFQTRIKSKSGDYVFTSPIDIGKSMTASKTFKRVSEEVGFTFSAHDLRRTVATVAAECGADLTRIGAVLNHSKQSVTEGYIQKTQPMLKQVLENIEKALFINDSGKTT